MAMAKQPVIYSAVILERGENWDTKLARRQQKQWDEHARFMDALVAEGFVILGGPLGDGENVLLILNAESRQAIETRLADDPWMPMGILRIAKVERWEILLDANQ